MCQIKDLTHLLFNTNSHYIICTFAFVKKLMDISQIMKTPLQIIFSQ